jgi:hypothetical protein
VRFHEPLKCHTGLDFVFLDHQVKMVDASEALHVHEKSADLQRGRAVQFFSPGAKLDDEAGCPGDLLVGPTEGSPYPPPLIDKILHNLVGCEEREALDLVVDAPVFISEDAPIRSGSGRRGSLQKRKFFTSTAVRKEGAVRDTLIGFLEITNQPGDGFTILENNCDVVVGRREDRHHIIILEVLDQLEGLRNNRMQISVRSQSVDLFPETLQENHVICLRTEVGVRSRDD